MISSLKLRLIKMLDRNRRSAGWSVCLPLIGFWCFHTAERVHGVSFTLSSTSLPLQIFYLCFYECIIYIVLIHLAYLPQKKPVNSFIRSFLLGFQSKNPVQEDWPSARSLGRLFCIKIWFRLGVLGEESFKIAIWRLEERERERERERDLVPPTSYQRHSNLKQHTKY